LEVNGGHGAISTVGKLQDGIEIWLNNMRSVEIAEDRKTAKIDGARCPRPSQIAFGLDESKQVC